MAKRVFWNEGHPDISAAPCPFAGVTISNYEDFTTLLKTRLFMPIEKGSTKGYYPPYVFHTKHHDIKILFRGTYGWADAVDIPTNPETGKPVKWAIYNSFNKSFKYFRLQDNFNEVYELFEDDDTIQRKIDALSSIVKKNGGITIRML